jgi:hypothetical protein
MQETVNGAPSVFVFNLDEVGTSDWEDRKSKMVVVSVAFAGPVHHRTSLVPEMMTSQAIEPVRLCLEKTGMRVGRDLILKHRQKPYIKNDLFVGSIRAPFLPHLAD